MHLSRLRNYSFRPPRPPRIESLEARTLLSGALGIADASVVEGNSGTTSMVFTVSLPFATFVPFTVDYTTVDGTAMAGQDYLATSGTLTFNVGDSSQTITVPVLGDRLIEGNEKFTVQLSNAFVVGIADGSATGTIIDDDKATVSLAATDGSASEAGPDPGNVRVSRSGPVTASLKVLLSVAGTASNGVDYTKVPASVVIKAGQAFADVPIKPIPDNNPHEGTETSIISLKSNSAYVIDSKHKSATVKIADREIIPPKAAITSNPGITAAGAQPYQFTVTYTDNKALNVASIATGNVQVTGVNGYSQTATLVSKSLSGVGTKQVTAVYSVPAPGGSWDSSDNGTYLIVLLANQVKDAAGNAITAGGMGQFAVAV